MVASGSDVDDDDEVDADTEQEDAARLSTPTVTCYVNHPIAPPERHNFIELPHETHFAKDPQGNKNKPRTEA